MKSKFHFHLCLAGTLLCILIGCKVKRPDDVIPESTMESLLYDYHLAKSLGENLSYNENYKKVLYMDAVFKKYGTTKADFDSSMVWYTRHTDILAKIYERVRERFRNEQEMVGDLIAERDKKPKMTKEGDSIDVWAWQHMLRLTGGQMSNRYAFILPTDSNYKERDTLVWEARYHFLNPLPADSSMTAVMALQVIYAKDTINRWTAVITPGVQQIRLYADTLGEMKEIKGFIYYSVKGEEKAGTLLVDCISMMRYHCQDTIPFAVRDSLNRAEVLADSLKKVNEEKKMRTGEVGEDQEEDNQRLTPEEMNRRRTGARPAKKPEQIEVERHIQQERRERQMNMRRQQQKRQQRASQ